MTGMDVARTIVDLRTYRDRLGQVSVALVPTMGALHAGHLALIAAAKATGAAVVTSIFVNPLQFGPGKDLARYPRDEAADLAMIRDFGCDLAWLPDAAVMYPPGDATVIEVAGPALRWEGERRPGHFRGVATVVAKLFGQIRPDTAFFGEKDWQQLQVVRRMVGDLALPVRIVGVPTVRDPNGLALSSRNRFLSGPEQAVAPCLYAVLRHVADRLGAGADPAVILEQSRETLRQAGLSPEYIELVDAETLEPLGAVQSPCRVIATARIGSVRLLDNVRVA